MNKTQRTLYRVSYLGFFNIPTVREFPTYAQAETWCRSIGRNDLISRIEEITQ